MTCVTDFVEVAMKQGVVLARAGKETSFLHSNGSRAYIYRVTNIAHETAPNQV